MNVKMCTSPKQTLKIGDNFNKKIALIEKSIDNDKELIKLIKSLAKK